MATRTKSGLGAVITLALVFGLATFFWPSPDEVKKDGDRAHRVRMILSVTNRVPAEITATRQGIGDDAPRVIFQGRVVSDWVHDEITHYDDTVRYAVSGVVEHANRRGTLSCRIDVDGQPVDEKKVIFHANDRTTSVACYAVIA